MSHRTHTTAHVIAVVLFHLHDIDPDSTVAVITTAALTVTTARLRLTAGFTFAH